MKAILPQSVTHPHLWKLRLSYHRVQIRKDLVRMGMGIVPPKYENDLELLRSIRRFCYSISMHNNQVFIGWTP